MGIGVVVVSSPSSSGSYVGTVVLTGVVVPGVVDFVSALIINCTVSFGICSCERTILWLASITMGRPQ